MPDDFGPLVPDGRLPIGQKETHHGARAVGPAEPKHRTDGAEFVGGVGFPVAGAVGAGAGLPPVPLEGGAEGILRQRALLTAG